MEPNGLPVSPHYETAIFTGNTTHSSPTLAWSVWTKPVGKSHATIIAIGSGGAGGSGVIGAAAAAAGGGGGGSGGVTIVDVPLSVLPSRLYVSVPHADAANGLSSTDNTYVSTQQNTTVESIVARASGGSAGGNASGATAGIAGVAGVIATAANMSFGWAYRRSVLAGQAGTAGGTTSNGVALTLPVTGIRGTGGSGGGGVPSAGTGSSGGAFTVPASPSYFPAMAGGLVPSSSTTAPGNGLSGFNVRDTGFYYYGGTGGGGTFGTATLGGLVQAAGGNGGVGSGGGGMGGARTGSTPAVVSLGGSGMVIIISY